MNHWLFNDFSDSLIEDHIFVDFIDDRLYIYKSYDDKSIVPLSMPLSFEVAGCMIKTHMNIE